MLVNELIDCAREKTGSDLATARAMQVPGSYVADWRAGIRACSAEDRALLADVAGVDPLPEIAAALMERTAGKAKGERLRTVLMSRLGSVGKS
jgi:hypothetical protein